MMVKINKKFRLGEFTLQQELRSCVNLIRQGLDIELEWGEIAGLKNYLQSYSIKGNRKTIFNKDTSLHLFLRDYFGVDVYAASSDDFLHYNIGRKRWYGKSIGLGFINLGYYYSSPEFKEYCKRHVRKWRDERTLI